MGDARRNNGNAGYNSPIHQFRISQVGPYPISAQ